MKTKVSKVITKVRNNVPLVQAITNYVTINDCANILLSYGASPAMVEAYDEAYEFAKISSAIYINIGSLTREQEQAIIEAGISAKKHNVPVVLDPVGCGAIPRKIKVINKLFEVGRIDIIKGNAGEIKFLAGVEAKSRGVDSVDDGAGLNEAAIELAKKYNCVVVVTGVSDLITDGTRTATVENGTEMLTKITGAGCMLGALCAATVGAEEDKFIAAVAATVAMGIAGELAFKESQVPGTFKCKLIDNIYLINDRIDIAQAVDAEGVHLGQKDMNLSIARKILGNEKIIGISAENLKEALEAENNGADYIGVGAVFYTGTKKDINIPIELSGLREICRNIKIPKVAIGGINASNIKSIIEAGADGDGWYLQYLEREGY